MKIYHNPSCSKCRSSLDMLTNDSYPDVGELEVVEYLKTSPNKDELKGLLKLLRLPARSILRSSEKIFTEHYANLNLDDEDAVLTAIAEHPILLERPIIVRGDRAVIGRPPENIQKLFSSQ